MTFLRNLFSFLLYSNLFIALCAVALVYQLSLLPGFPIPWTVYGFVFFGTVSEYNLHRFVSLVRSRDLPQEERYFWLEKNKPVFYFITLFSFAAVAYCFLHLPARIYPTLIVLAIATVLYSLPFIPARNGLKRLRSIPFMKIFMISAIWTGATVVIPAVSVNRYDDEVAILLWERFFFIFAITLPFDIRDMEGDEKKGLLTIPTSFGRTISIGLSIAALLASCALAFVNPLYQSWAEVIAIVLTSVITGYIILRQDLTRHPFYYFGLLDGTMILSAFFFLVAEKFV